MQKIHHIIAKKRIRELEEKMANLRQSDNRLFSNANGNLPTYDAWTSEVLKLEKGLKKNKPVTPYNPQTDTKINF